MRHPKGARSLGIGHPQSGDRCAETRPYPIDPLGSPSSPPQQPRQGVALTSQSISATHWRGHISYLRHRFQGSTALRVSTRG